jgi:carbonic anhydrase/acetyltransferase-like protein (isoleucine patch superfamily)
MMGSPAKLVRSLDEAARLRLLKSAEGYRANAARFAAGMKPVA